MFTPDSHESGVSRAGVNVLSTSVTDESLKKFWEVEEPPTLSTHLSQVDELVEQHYRENTLMCLLSIGIR